MHSDRSIAGRSPVRFRTALTASALALAIALPSTLGAQDAPPSAGQEATRAATPTTYSLFPATAVPAVLDFADIHGPVELGVRFFSDRPGTVSGIRFYKAATDTGPHSGSLWAADGALLATATFAGETASGWQQVSFSTPVPIAKDTIYVASYFNSTSHYSCDDRYFAGKGVDAPPLHAPADQAPSGPPNGVFAYGAASQFPSQTYRSLNYWVDVVFTPTAGLQSIAVTPSSPQLKTGTTLQLTATGTYDDQTTQDLTSQVTWSSSNPKVATVTASGGLVSAVAPGATTLSASLGPVTGQASLTVTPASGNVTSSSGGCSAGGGAGLLAPALALLRRRRTG